MPSETGAALAAELLSGARVTQRAEREISPMAAELVSQFMGPAMGPEARVFYDAEKQAPAADALAAGVATDPARQIEIFAQRRGIPKERYAVIDGEVVYKADDGKYYAEVPGWFTSPGQKLAFGAPDIAETALGMAGNVATAPMLMAGPTGMAGYVGVNTLIGSGLRAGRQALAGQPLNLADAAIEGGLNAIPATGAGATRTVVGDRALARDFKEWNRPATAELRKKADAEGINLTPAESTGLRSLKDEQKVLGNLPRSGEVMQDFYNRRFVDQVQPAVSRFLDSISLKDDLFDAGSLTQRTLTQRRKDMVEARASRVKPLYAQAYKSDAPVSASKAINFVNAKMENAKDTELRALQRIYKMLTKEVPLVDDAGDLVRNADGIIQVEKLPENRIEAMHRVRMALDALSKEEGVQGLDAVIQTEIGQVRELINSQLKSIDAFRAADQKFAEMSGPIQRFDDSRAFGITKMNADNVEQIADKIFGAGSSPQTVKYMREQIEAVDPDAWNAITRNWLQKTWGDMTKVRKGATEERVDAGADWARALLGDLRTQSKMVNALGKESYQALRNLSDVLIAAGKVKKIGSDTAFNQEIIEQLKREAPGTLTKLGKLTGTAVTPQLWGTYIRDWVGQRSFEKHLEEMARIVTSDNAMDNLRRIKRISHSKPAFWAALTTMFVDMAAAKADISDIPYTEDSNGQD